MGRTQNKVIVALITAVVSLTSVTIADTATLDASVTIPATCGIVVDPTTIDFGSVQTGGTSSVESTDVTNRGSVPAQISIRGTNWSGTSGSFDVSYTKFGDTSSPATPLLASDQILFNSLGNGDTASAYFRMSVPYGQSAGSYSQTITFTSTC
jgi:hypothetical protein